MRFSTSVLATVLAASSAIADTFDLRLMSYNIRYATSELEAQEKPWADRLPLMTAQLNHETAGRPGSLMCFQEALYQQAEDLRNGLGKNNWDYIGVGRDDGAKAGEMSPIFYQPSAWELLDNKTYWLSETPDTPGSKGWDASLPRIVTVGKFEHIKTGSDFVFMCTHYDYKGQVAQVQSSDLIVNLTSEWADGAAPVFLGGDLNATPDSEAYKILASKLNDVDNVIPKDRHYGYKNTYTGFNEDPADDSVIDHLFVKDSKSVEWVSFAVPNNRAGDGTFISDHRPLIVDVKVPFKKNDKEESRTLNLNAEGEARLELIRGRSRIVVSL
ncbi:hypothetical protein N3K66_008078 [Trichothecium roseum]|uniref:Uncharacterized protein n=1 Tax=Trichothecium roseum TaxID=47278 RepID=A0ACC0USG8_9HYPO|nr:hypothetical protein N3K66_008078 [Trichothecium roseum]